MSEHPVDRARDAMNKLVAQFPLLTSQATVHIGWLPEADGCGVKVNFRETPERQDFLPKQIDGVIIVVEVTGPLP